MSKVVFVGNVPYNMGEDQLIEVFKTVGTVVGFRLVFDRETGKPRGYGFCEFADNETALSAVRNLNNTDCGGRPLRIDLADSDPFLEGKTTMRGELIDNTGGGWRDRHRDSGSERDRDYRPGQGSRSGGGSGNGGGPDAWLNALPRGTPLAPGVTAMDAISQTVAGVRPVQMMEVLASMKTFILDNPDRAHALLSANPQLAYALFQALLVNQIVDPGILHRMIAATSMQNQQPPAPAPPAHQNAPPALPPHMLPPPQYPPQHMTPPAAMYQQPSPGHMGYPPAGAPAPAPVPSHNMGYPPSSAPAAAPAQSGYYQPPMPLPQQQQQQQQQPSSSGSADSGTTVPDAQRAMLMQMLQLTNEQVNALPPNERQAIQQLRSQFMALGNSLGQS